MRYAVFLSLLYEFDVELYHKTFKQVYETGSSPMTRHMVIIGNDGLQEATDIAAALVALKPKVIE